MFFYLVGIRGSALSSLCRLLLKDGHIVKGVDVFESFYTDKGIDNIETFDNMNLKKSYYYIIGNAYIDHNVTNYILKMGYYYKYYPSFLTSYYKNKKWICVSGSHGKTTTTKLISHILDNNCALIGDGSCNYGKGDYFILEACEYKNTFLNYKPNILLVLNIDYDHPDFFKTEEDYKKSFDKMINKSDIAIVNGNDYKKESDHIISFGSNSCDVNFKYEDGKVYILNKPFYLPYNGLHFAYDFVGAYLVCKLLNIKDIDIQNKLYSFVLPKRRMETIIINNQIIISDYAHHPTEIKCVYDSIKEKYSDKRIIVIFEPHTISRLETYLYEFKSVLSLFDECYLYPLFSSARESNQTNKEYILYNHLGFERYYLDTLDKLLKKDNVVICFLGAGKIDKLCDEYKIKILK